MDVPTTSPAEGYERDQAAKRAEAVQRVTNCIVAWFAIQIGSAAVFGAAAGVVVNANFLNSNAEMAMFFAGIAVCGAALLIGVPACLVATCFAAIETLRNLSDLPYRMIALGAVPWLVTVTEFLALCWWAP